MLQDHVAAKHKELLFCKAVVSLILVQFLWSVLIFLFRVQGAKKVYELNVQDEL
jgi:hypothetical protein